MDFSTCVIWDDFSFDKSNHSICRYKQTCLLTCMQKNKCTYFYESADILQHSASHWGLFVSYALLTSTQKTDPL